MDVDHRHCDARAGAGSTIGLACVGSARFFQSLQCTGGVRNTGFGEQIDDVATAALENAEHISRSNGFPRGQRQQLRQHAERFLGCFRIWQRRTQNRRWPAIARIGLAKNVVLEGQNAVVVRRTAKQHRAGRHDAAFCRLNDRHVTGATTLFNNAVIRRINETHKLRCFTIQQRVTHLRIAAAWILPIFGKARQYVRRIARLNVDVRLVGRTIGLHHRRRATVTIRATQIHAIAAVHAGAIRGGVAADASRALCLRIGR